MEKTKRSFHFTQGKTVFIRVLKPAFPVNAPIKMLMTPTSIHALARIVINMPTLAQPKK